MGQPQRAERYTTGRGVFEAFQLADLAPVRNVAGHASARCPACDDESLMLATAPAFVRCVGGCVERVVRLRLAARAATLEKDGHHGPAAALSVLLAEADRVAPDTVPPLACDAARAAWATDLPAVIATGIGPLDRLLGGGLRAQSIYELAGPPGAGKTSLGVQVARGVGRTRDVLYATTEIPERQVLARLAGQELGESWLQLWEARDGRRVAAALTDLRVRVLEVGRETDLMAVATRLAEGTPDPPLLVLDYIQDLARRGNPDDRRLAVAAVSDEIRGWCLRTKGTAVLISAVARSLYASDGSRTARDYLGAAKESGDVDYDASGILYLDVDAPGGDGTSQSRLHLSKSRYSAGGTIGLRYLGARGEFVGDVSATLTELEREVFEAIEMGAETLAAVEERVTGRRQSLSRAIQTLRSRGLVTDKPLRAVSR